MSDSTKTITKSPYRGDLYRKVSSRVNMVYDPLYDWKICLEGGQVQEPDTGQVGRRNG
ncbi:hypothetical protein JNUCC42_12065 [Brevibacterium sp. JNUCC-42]|nr:hypothetical protein JNUCC42_12065 [Brevibacterium sp. JNUCC-42]